MAKKIEVIIDGKETVSDAADGATRGVEGFTGKIKGWFQSFVDFKAAWDMASGAIDRVKQVILDSFDAYDEMLASQRKLQGTAKLTGVALEDLQAIADLGRRGFGLSAVVANDFAAEIAKLTQKAGATDKAAEALRAFLDIGAARGLTASETLKAVQQSILGIDEGQDKLFGRNPSALWSDYADAIGKSPGKMTDADKAMVLLLATIDGGGKVLGSYGQYLDTTAGQADRFAQRNREAASLLGQSMNELRDIFYRVGSDVVPWLYDQFRRNFDGITATIANAKGVIFEWTAAVAKALGQTDQYEAYAKKAKDAFDKYEEYYRRSKTSASELAEQNKKLGGTLADVIPAAKNAGTAIASVVSPLDQSARSFGTTKTAVYDFGASLTSTASTHTAAAEKHESSARRTNAAVKSTTDKGAEEAARMQRVIDEKLGKPLAIVIGITEEAVRSLSEAAGEQLPSGAVDKFKQAMAEAAAAAKKAEENIKQGITPALDDSVPKALLMTAYIHKLASGVLEVADGFGLSNTKAAELLSSVVSIAEGIGRMYSGDVVGGAAGLIGSLGNLIAALENPENRRIAQDNTEQLRRLRTELSALDLKIDGNEFAKAQNFLSGFLNTLKTGNIRDLADFQKKMMEAGVTKGELERVAKELGIELYNKDGVASMDRLQQLLDALNGTMLGSVGNNFDTQFEMFRRTQRLQGNDNTMGGLDGLLNFLRNVGGVKALDGIDLNDPAAARQALVDLFVKMQTGQGIGAEGLGTLTGRQFADIIEELIRGIDTATPSDGPLTGPIIRVGNGTTAPNTGSLVGGDGTSGTNPVTVPSTTLDNVIAKITEQMSDLGKYHREDVQFFERIANATEATAMNTADALRLLAYLPEIAGNWSEAGRARELSRYRRIFGSPSL